MRGTKFLIVFVFGLFGLNESSAQIFMTELFSTRKDSLYDYQIYQRYSWWPYSPQFQGKGWQYPQSSALNYIPSLKFFYNPNYCHNYIFGCPSNHPKYQNDANWYSYFNKNKGNVRNNRIYEGNPLISTNKNSIDRVLSQAYTIKNFKEDTQSDIDQSAVINDKSENTVLNIDNISTQRIVLVKQPAHGKEISFNNSQGKDQLKTNLKERGSWNTESISEKIKKDFKLSSGTRKVYVVDKPKRTNGWENFRGIYNRSSQNNGNQGTEKTYSNNNTQHSYSSGSGNNTQRKNSPHNSSRVSKVSVSKTRD
jgi:hypothetical protein